MLAGGGHGRVGGRQGSPHLCHLQGQRGWAGAAEPSVCRAEASFPSQTLRPGLACLPALGLWPLTQGIEFRNPGGRGETVSEPRARSGLPAPGGRTLASGRGRSTDRRPWSLCAESCRPVSPISIRQGRSPVQPQVTHQNWGVDAGARFPANQPTPLDCPRNAPFSIRDLQWIELCLPKRHVEVLIPEHLGRDLIQTHSLCRCPPGKRRPRWSGMGHKSTPRVLLRVRDADMHREGDTKTRQRREWWL